MTVKLLGDPHLGRHFTKGIPVEHRGEREQLVREDFNRHLSEAEGATAHICMGDLFDKPQVDYATVQFAYRAYRQVARLNPRTTFYIIQGNHDDSRDLDEVTAWDLFCDLVERIPNIVCVTEPIVSPPFVLLPWNPTVTAVEQLHSVIEEITLCGVTQAYGHWDVDPRSSSHNLIPTKELAELGIVTAYTGHIHKPDVFKRDGVTVHVVGSMQPYAQGEDGGQSTAVRYLTMGLEEMQLTQPESLVNACVRLQLLPGEQWDQPIPECRSWDVQRVQLPSVDTDEPVSLDGFDTNLAYREALDAHEIIPEVRSRIDERWAESFAA